MQMKKGLMTRTLIAIGVVAVGIMRGIAAGAELQPVSNEASLLSEA